MFVDPVSQSVALSQAIVNIRARNTTDLGRYEFAVTWNASVLDLRSISDGGFLGSTGNPISCSVTVLAANQVHYLCIELGPNPGPGGNGLLATLSYATLANGVSPINLSGVALRTTGDLAIPLLVADGSVTVALPTATPTPTPTATATFTPTNTPTNTPTKHRRTRRRRPTRR